MIQQTGMKMQRNVLIALLISKMLKARKKCTNFPELGGVQEGNQKHNGYLTV